MVLSFAEAKVLATLHRSDRALAMRELRARAGLSDQSARNAARELVTRGLASATDRIPAYYRPTDSGRSEVEQPKYREFLRPTLTTTTNGEEVKPMVDVQGHPGPNGPTLSVNWNEDPSLDNAETQPAWGGKTSARTEHTG